MYLVIIAILGIIGYGIYIMDKLKKTKVEVGKAWEDVTGPLKHRFEILPGVVDVAKNYATEDINVLQNAINSRNIYMSLTTPGELMDIESKLSRSIKNIIALADKYPNLGNDRNFMAYLNEINKTEEKISMTRQKYNQVTKKYNDIVNKFPSCYVAKLLKYKPEKFFELTSEEKENIDFLL